MLGHITQDLSIVDPRNRPAALGSITPYRPQVRAPYLGVPQNLRAANKPSETNVVNQLPVFVTFQSPIQTNQVSVGRLLSSYTFLPAQKSQQATFGST
jgi:hypothetical protein